MGLYRLLLRLFPASFRAEYGDEMCAVFAKRLRNENAVALWAVTIPDIVVNAAYLQIDVLRQDVRWTLHSLWRSRRFASTAVAVTALGIAAATAAFTLLDHVLLRPLPFSNPDRLVILDQTDPARGITRLAVSPPNYMDWKEMSTSFASMGPYGRAEVNLIGEGDPTRLEMAAVASGAFRAVAVQPVAGRLFGAADDAFDAPEVAVLSNGLATTLFGDVASALGRTLNLGDRIRTVVGVMPAGFAFPSPEVAVWLPYRFSREALSDRGDRRLAVVARLRPGVSIEAAQAELDLIASQLEQAHPVDNGGLGAAVIPMRDALISSQARMLLIAVFGAALCVILIGCANLASLLFVRAMNRRREIAVRITLGAGRERLFRQLLTESLVLGVAGGALGVALATVATPLLSRLIPDQLPVGHVPAVDLRILAFAALSALLTSIAFGVGPALRSCDEAPANALRARSGTDSRAARSRSGFVIAQVCATVILLVCTGLLLEAMWRVQAVDPGFRSEGVSTLRTELPASRYGDVASRRSFYNGVLSRVRELPGVDAAAYTSFLPIVFGAGIKQAGVQGGPEDAQVSVRFVTSDYFATLGIPLLQGRDVSAQDDATAPPVTVISRSLAERLWPGRNPVGRTIDVEDVGLGRTVVGVVGDVAARGLERSSEPQMYFPYQQQSSQHFYAPKDLAIRVSGDAAAVIPTVRRIVRETDPEQVVSNVRSLDDILASETGSRRTQLSVLGIFAAVALLLAAVGIHGLLSYTVSTRAHELGIRLALGARRQDVLRMFLRQGFALGIAGVAAAVPLAYAAGRAMEPLLFGVAPAELPTYAAAAALALAMTLAGSLEPALRAAKVEPAVTIRNE